MILGGRGVSSLRPLNAPARPFSLLEAFSPRFALFFLNPPLSWSPNSSVCLSSTPESQVSFMYLKCTTSFLLKAICELLGLSLYSKSALTSIPLPHSLSIISLSNGPCLGSCGSGNKDYPSRSLFSLSAKVWTPSAGLARACLGWTGFGYALPEVV